MDVFTIAGWVAAAAAGALAAYFYAQKIQAEGKTALAEARLKDAQATREHWEAVRTQMTEAAKASVLSAGNDISSKLLADHKREAEAARKEQAEVAQQTNQQLHQQFQHIVEQVAALKSSDVKQDTRLATLWRALSTPAGAGQLAEIGLENTLKSLSLEPGRDFVMQYTMPGHTEGAKLKPDCVIFLPQQRAMVIDCKASKFMLELAEAETHEQRTQALANLRRTMGEHLKALISRDYKTAITAHEASRGQAFAHTYSIMHLPSESALAWLREADPEFPRKAEQAGIILTGPSGLYGLLSLAKVQLSEVRQEQNRQKIVELSEKLIDSVVAMFLHLDKAGRSLSAAAEAYSNISKSANSFVLPRMRSLVKEGANPKKADAIPTRLPGFQLITLEEAPTIEHESAEKHKLQHVTSL